MESSTKIFIDAETCGLVVGSYLGTIIVYFSAMVILTGAATAMISFLTNRHFKKNEPTP